MLAELQSSFDILEKQRRELMRSVEHLRPDVFSKRVHPQRWSSGEILAHLQVSEKLSVQYINKKILGMDSLAHTHLGHDVLMIILILSQRLPFKYKAPSVVVNNTPSVTSFDELASRWDKTRLELSSLLEKFGKEDLTKKIYRHPAVGLINIRQALRFFGEHIIHHQPQIKKILKVT